MRYRNLPPLNALKALDAVARHGSFSAAARSLGVSQGAVSRHIANLEDVLGCALFVRGKQGADLTQQGQRFVGQISPALSLILLATEECRAEPTGSGALRISTSSSFAVKWLAPRLQGFQGASSGVAVDLTISDSCPDFAAGTCDIAVIPAAKPQGSAMWEHLFDEVLIPICSPAYAARMSLKAPEDLARSQLIHTTTRLDIWAGWADAHGIDVPARRAKTSEFGFQDFYLSIEAAVSGTGLALVPQFLVAEAIAKGALVAPIGCPYRSGHAYWLVTSRGSKRHKSVTAFRRWLNTQISTISDAVSAAP